MYQILLVEDNAPDAMLLQRSLRGIPHNLTHVQRLSEAREHLVGGNPVDVVLLDLGLPDAWGLEAVQQLREFAPHTPCIVLTGAAEGRYGASALREGAEDFLSKDELSPVSIRRAIAYAIERHQRLQATRAAADGLRRIVEANPDAMLVFDEAQRIRLANPAAAELLRHPLDELVGGPLPFTLNTIGPTIITLDHGAQKKVEIKTASLEWEGETAWLASMRDITEQLRAEAFRRQMTRTERLAAIGQLAAGVAHEINNPATVLLANLELIQNDLPALQGGLTHDPDLLRLLSEAQEMLQDSLESIQRIRQVTRDLKGFSRTENEGPEPLDVNELIQLCCGFTRHQIRHRARLQLNLGDMPLIVGERSGLSQVLLNLLLNATQAIPEGDPASNFIRVTSHLKGGGPDERIVITVEDSGEGIPPSIQERIFDPFFTTRPAGVGTGLGLPLSLEIVQRHKGTINVSSRPHDGLRGGSRFEVELPIHNGLHPAPAAAQAQPEVPLPPLRVLIIDDEEPVLRALEKMLTPPCTVVSTHRAQLGLTILETQPGFDVILCDLMMPEMDGAAFYESLRERSPEQAERVIFCSGGAVTEQMRRFCEETCLPMIEKPVGRRELRRALSAVKAVTARPATPP